jgi:hypothetical protein
MTAHALPLIALAVVLPWSVYRRVRRNLGPQPLVPWRLKTRCTILLAVLGLIALPSLQQQNLPALAALLGAGLAGVGVAAFALRHTRFEQRDGADFYVPNAVIGLVLSALLLARVAWRMVQMYPLLTQPGGPPPDALQALNTPLTTALIGLVLAYYAAYCVGVLRHPARPAAAPAAEG